MVTAALLHLKDRNGSSRQALKKYIAGNYKVGEQSDLHINVAIKRGVETGDFVQPKGQSGPVKLAKKEPKKKVVKEKKAKTTTTKKAPKKAAVKKDVAKVRASDIADTEGANVQFLSRQRETKALTIHLFSES